LVEPKVFKIKGTFRMGDNPRQPFTRYVPATSDEEALEKLYSDLGSEHGVKRTEIEIHEITEVDPSEIEDPTLRELLGVE